jgi:alpha-tubulin suppressor-like RCC1 family protein
MINNILINATKVPPVPPTTFSEMWGMGNFEFGQLDNDASRYNFLQVGTATTWVSGSGGAQHGLAIQSNGTLWSWGGNAFGQLGFNDGLTRSSPVQVGTLNTWYDVSSRDYHTIAKRTDGTLWSWGQNQFGSLGLNDFTLRSSPVQVGTLNTWTGDISTGQNVSMMIRSDGTLWGMGDHRYGRLGWGSSSVDLLPIDSGTTWVSASTGQSHTVAIKNNGTMWSWGQNNLGQLGEGPLGSAFNKYSPVQIGLLNTWSKVSAGTNHNMAIKTDGTLWGWGQATTGKLGDNTTTTKSSPVQIGTRTWTNVYSGENHTIAIRTDGTLWAWGSNNNGQLGDNTGVNKSSPVQIGTLNNWSSASTTKNDFSYANTAAIKTDGTLWIWGQNNYGNLGNNTVTFTYRSSPVQLGTETNWASVSVHTHVLALKTNGTIWSWGNNDGGQLGIGDIAPVNNHRSSPVQIGTLNTWSKIFAGNRSSFAIKTDGTLWGWGDNINSQLGDGTFIRRSSPVQIGTRNDWLTADVNSNAMFATNSPGGLYSVGIHIFLGRPNLLSSPVQIGTLTWSRVSVGTSHTMGIRTDGTLWAWGTNPAGARGDNTLDTDVNSVVGLYSPVQIGTLNNWSRITAAGQATHAIKTDGTMWGWGIALESGLSTNINRSSPVQIGTRNDWSKVESNSTSNNSILALRTDNTLWSWGYNFYGSIGDGTNVNKSSPIQIKSNLSWKNIFVGAGTAFAIDTNGKLYSSGLTNQFNTGYDLNQRSPVQIGTLSSWKIVTAGSSHTIAISQSGSLWGFGYNGQGQLGDNTIVDKNSPVQIGTLTTWVSASCGVSHTMALKSDGTLWAWGLNNLGQLGNGTSFPNQSSPVQIGTRNDWVDISSGYAHSLALRNDGSLWSWGYNGTGELGQNISSFSITSPVQVGGDTNWSKIAGGAGNSLALRTNGTLWSWGDNSNGGVGDNTAVTRSSPVQIGTRNDWTNIHHESLITPGGFAIRSDGTLWGWGYTINHNLGLYHPGSEIAKVMTQKKFTNLAAGGSHSMAVSDDGTLWGWGQNSDGQLGTGNTTSTTSSPVQIGTLNNWSKVFAAFRYTTSIKTNGTLWTWGFNGFGQLGDGTAAAKSSPVQIGTLTNWSTIAVGNNHALALKTDGTIWSWGFNGNGELGQNILTSINRSSPVQIGTRNDWTWIGAGSNHSMAVRSDGTLWTWGASVRGEGGRGTTTAVSSPVQIGTLTNWLKAQGGGYFTLAVKTDGTLWGWGNNAYGQLAQNNSTTNRSSPVQIGTLTNWSDVFPGEDGGSVVFGSALARKTDGTIWAWGLNANGQNGQGEILINARSSPVQIGTRTDFASGSLGENHGIALLNDGTLASWGIQSAAVLGQLLTFNTARSSPTQVGDFNTSWGGATISRGGNYTVARKADGTLWAWGVNTNGQLGFGDSINRSSPVQVGTLSNWKFLSTGNIHTVLIKEYTQ